VDYRKTNYFENNQDTVNILEISRDSAINMQEWICVVFKIIK